MYHIVKYRTSDGQYFLSQFKTRDDARDYVAVLRSRGRWAMYLGYGNLRDFLPKFRRY